MKETGTIMSGSHPVDILEGRKTMTRRTRGLKEINECPDAWEQFGFDNSGRFSFRLIGGDRILNIACPYGQVGDRLWVKETWCLVNYGYLTTDSVEVEVGYNKTKWNQDQRWDSASHTISKTIWDKYRGNDKWRSPLFMPRWASRITREITAIRAERLQEITEGDIRKEGITDLGLVPVNTAMLATGTNNLNDLRIALGRAEYASLWDSLNGKRYPWKMNPWVWPIEFGMIKQ